MYDKHLDPIGDQPIRRLLATFCAFYFNAHRGEDIGPASADDFMPWVERQQTAPPDEDAVRKSLAGAGLIR